MCMETNLTTKERDWLESFLSCCFETGGSDYYIYDIDCEEEHKVWKDVILGKEKSMRIAKCEIFKYYPDAVLRIYALDGETESECKWFTLTAKQMLKAIEGRVNQVSVYKDGMLKDEIGDYDNFDADVAMQHALYGGIVYG